MTDFKIGDYKCPQCGWVHIAITREFAIASNYDIARLEKCFRCGAPSVGFVPAEAGDAPLLSTLQAVVLKADDEDQRMRQELLDTAADLGTHGVTAAEDIARIQALCIPRRGDR